MTAQRNLIIYGENIRALKYLLEERGLKGRSSTISSSSHGSVAYTDNILGDDFVSYIRERLLLMKELLSEKGSIYLHTDYKIGHYLKVMMDSVFGIDNFRNDITRIKCNPKNFKRLGYGNIKDMILFYTKSKNAIWHEPKIPYEEADGVQ